MYSSTLNPSLALPETVISNKDLLHSMEGERLATLEQALAELQAKDANTQHKLDILISHIPQSKNLIPSTQITLVTPKAHGLKPALSLEFNGDHTKGMMFLNSCQVYICLCPNSFMDEQAKIVWAMSYMKGVLYSPQHILSGSERNGRNLVGMSCQWEHTQIWLGLGMIPTKFQPNSNQSERNDLDPLGSQSYQIPLGSYWILSLNF